MAIIYESPIYRLETSFQPEDENGEILRLYTFAIQHIPSDRIKLFGGDEETNRNFFSYVSSKGTEATLDYFFHLLP